MRNYKYRYPALALSLAASTLKVLPTGPQSGGFGAPLASNVENERSTPFDQRMCKFEHAALRGLSNIEHQDQQARAMTAGTATNPLTHPVSGASRSEFRHISDEELIRSAFAGFEQRIFSSDWGNELS
jgi:hypothetical protein